jgi:tetratricopeptide (TPR) repeat protein
MIDDLSDDVVRAIRNRQALLWVCQRYDLIPGEIPHDYDVQPELAGLRYRQETSKTDREFAALYWEAVWLEGAASPVLSCLRESESNAVRPLVLLATAADANARVSSLDFLPVAVLPGVLQTVGSPDSRYGHQRKRIRERIAWELANRLSQYPGRVLVVLGCREFADLELLYQILEDAPIRDLRVVIVWPGVDGPQRPNTASVSTYFWRASEEQLLDTLATSGAPRSDSIQAWRVRLGRGSVALEPRDVDKILGRFALLTEELLIPKTTLTVSDINNFLKGSLESWAAYTHGLPVPRSYRSALRLTISEEAQAIVNTFGQNTRDLTHSLQLPCEAGSGATTLLRSAAFNLASIGNPTIILRPGQVQVDLDELVAFSVSLAEAASRAGISDAPPLVVVTDVDHEGMPNVRQIAQALAAYGRPALVLQGLSLTKENRKELRVNRLTRLKPLFARIGTDDASSCESTFRKLVNDWKLPIDVPSHHEWRAYEKATAWHMPYGQEAPRSLFWVALRFFLTSGMQFTDRQSAEDALGEWIEKRIKTAASSEMQALLASIAILSSYRIAAPLWTVLRPITSTSFSDRLSAEFSYIDDLVEWETFSPEINDQVLRFTHPAIADEYLRRRGVRTPQDKANALKPVLSTLSPGHLGDVWMAESFAADILPPAYEERRETNWAWRISVFESLPVAVAEQSKTILHHWARCLYLSAEKTAIPKLDRDERLRRVTLAITKLLRALELPSRPGRTEHPSHLNNTLGTAYSRLAALAEEVQQPSDKFWANACSAFERAIEFAPSSNVEVLLAYGRRLAQHATADTADNRTGRLDQDVNERDIKELARALSLFDSAEELLGHAATPDPDQYRQVRRYKSEVLNALSSDSARSYIGQLKLSRTSDLGWYCEARLALGRYKDESRIYQALSVFTEAESNGVSLQGHSLTLQLALLNRLPGERFNFQKLLKLRERLAHMAGYTLRPVDRFRHAVLCYQVGRFAEGAELFRRLREHTRRSGDIPPRFGDIWRRSDVPSQPRRALMRVGPIRSEWRAEAYVEELQHSVPFRPRHFNPMPKENDIVACAILFQFSGPLAVPERFLESSENAR